MNCEKVRDRFSSLLEGDLNSLEEKVVREHLTSCSECQKDFEKFEKTLRWLHSIEEEEVPDEFISEIYSKMENRKRMGLFPRWFNQLVRLKLPVQAVAMVAIVFLVLYLNKRMPIETPRLGDIDQRKPPQSEVSTIAQLVQKEAERGETERPSSEKPQEKKMDALAVPKVMEEGKVAAPSRKNEMMAAKAPQPKETEKGERLLSAQGEVQKMVMAKEKVLLAEPPLPEIILRVPDRKKAFTQLLELVNQFGGEIVKEEGNFLLASLPTVSFPKFKEELEGLSFSKEVDERVPQKKVPEGKGESPSMKRRKSEEKDKELARPLTDQESHIAIRIFLLQE